MGKSTNKNKKIKSGHNDKPVKLNMSFDEAINAALKTSKTPKAKKINTKT